MSVKGIVKNLTDYGAFVDLGGVDGLLHITDMAWKRIKHPGEIVNVGDDLVLCAGSLAEAYENMGGQTSWHGKPHVETYHYAHELLGQPSKGRICAIGDSLRTDVQGAGIFGIDCIWNLVGIHFHEVTREQNLDWQLVADEFEKWTYTPQMIMCGLKP